ncbi:MAG: hypothetical protein IPO21_21255 [Bacteroidales bacterium]|nr:hypothetical protein [Bacteroidales bacterium]
MRKNRFKFIGDSNSEKLHTGGFPVTKIYEESAHSLWIATDGGGLYNLNFQTNTTKHFSAPQYISNNAVLDIEPNGDGKLWLATWGGGICLFDPKTEKSNTYKPEINKANWINNKNVKAIFKDENFLWIACHGNGVNIYDIAQNQFYNTENPSKLFNFNLATPYWNNDIFKDSKNNFWFSTAFGLYKWDGKELTNFNNHPSAEKNPLNSYISMVYEDSNNHLWICSNALMKYDSYSNTFTNVNISYSNLPKNTKAIVQESDDKFWVSSNNGISCIDLKNNSVRTFQYEDGLQGNAYSDKAVMKSNNGMLYFGGSDGLNYFDPNLFSENSMETNVYITALNLWNNNDEHQGGNLNMVNYLGKDLQNIPFDISRFISFEYIAPGYHNSEKKQYAYWLFGHSDKKYSVGNERKATFTNLSPGIYTFKVISANSEGFWNNVGESITFTILPPWWSTWWFRLIMIICISLIIAFVFYLRVRNIMKQKTILENTVQQRTVQLTEANVEIETQNKQLFKNQKEIELKNIELSTTIVTKDKLLSIIAHDLKNPIGAIVGLLELLDSNFHKYSDDKKQSYVKVTLSSAQKIQHELVNLLDWARAQTQNLNYTPQITNLNLLIKNTLSLLNQTAKTKKIEILFNAQPEILAFVDERMISTVIRNIVSNAIKFTPNEGLVNISVENSTNKKVKIIISDSGVGMTNEQMNKLNEPNEYYTSYGTNNEKGTGLGIKICQEFIAINKGTLNIYSTPLQGSTFTITLPTK